jgi:cytochrome P450
MPMGDLDQADFFSDPALVADPLPFYRRLRERGPVVRLAPYDVVAVTGYEETVAVFRDDENLSAVVSAGGPLPPLPFTPEGDDITAQIDRHRHEMPFAGLIPTLDPPDHTRLKSLLMGMITPKRLKQNEAAMWRLADQQIESFIGRGELEVILDYAYPFTGYVICDLLGVPPEDYGKLEIERPSLPGQIGTGGADNPHNLYHAIEGYFTACVEQRRREPGTDVISDLAKVRFADGTLPPVIDVVKVASFLFGAGQGTTARLLAASLRHLAEDPELQARLRADRTLIPDFVEETLRLQGSVKSDFRLVKKPTKIGDLEVAPGTIVMMLISAVNRDPDRFERPDDLRLGRPNIREHLAFGRGIHSCVGAPLARAEARVTVERFLELTRDIRIDEDKHGPPGARRYSYMPTYLLLGLNELHLKFTPA